MKPMLAKTYDVEFIERLKQVAEVTCTFSGAAKQLDFECGDELHEFLHDNPKLHIIWDKARKRLKQRLAKGMRELIRSGKVKGVIPKNE